MIGTRQRHRHCQGRSTRRRNHERSCKAGAVSLRSVIGSRTAFTHFHVQADHKMYSQSLCSLRPSCAPTGLTCMGLDLTLPGVLLGLQ